MEFEAARAREFFYHAAAALPPEDRRSMVPAEIMAPFIAHCLSRIETINFQVFSKRIIALTSWRKWAGWPGSF